MDSCHSYTYVSNDREVHNNFVMGFVTWKLEAQVIMYQLSTSSYHLHIWYETANYAQKGKANIYEKKRDVLLLGDSSLFFSGGYYFSIILFEINTMLLTLCSYYPMTMHIS